MKRMLTFIACCIITGVSSAGYGSYDFTPGYRIAATEVYICVSSGAKVYHIRENCQGLNPAHIP